MKSNSRNMDNIDNIDKSFTGNNEIDYKRGQHPNSKSNLKPFEKGVSGNPKGRPTKYSKLKEKLKEIGDMEHFEFLGESLGKKRNVVLNRIWDEAIRGDLKFIQFLASLSCFDE